MTKKTTSLTNHITVAAMPDIKPYTINVPQEKIDKLNRKLDDYDWPAELEDHTWDYGSPSSDSHDY